MTKAGRGSRRRIGPGISHRRFSHSNVNKATQTSRVSNLGILLYSFFVHSYYCFSKAEAENAAGVIALVAKISVIFALDLKSGRGGGGGGGSDIAPRLSQPRLNLLSNFKAAELLPYQCNVCAACYYNTPMSRRLHMVSTPPRTPPNPLIVALKLSQQKI